jgi:peptide/nickel transport system substrate-binding protein
MTPRLLSVAAAVAVALMTVSPAAPRGVKEGGTFRVAFLTGFFHTIDPALWEVPSQFQLIEPACGALLDYPSKAPPGGFQIAPSIAGAEPVISSDGKTYTFTIRKDARFSNGQRVTARAFAHALDRIRDPAMESGLRGYFGAVRDVDATGRTLRVRLTTPRPPGLLDAITYLCAVPPNLSADPEGPRAPLHGAGPYYVAQYVPGERLVLKRNRFYRGERPHHVDRITADLAAVAGTAVDQVANGTFDYVLPAINAVAPRAEELVRRYGFNKSQFWVRAGAGIRLFVLNTSRPLFRKNPKLRQAVNFAVDRKAIAREAGLYAETPTDQFLLPDTPGLRRRAHLPAQGARPEEGEGAREGPDARRQGCPLHAFPRR